jgi:hypothetical protein
MKFLKPPEPLPDAMVTGLAAGYPGPAFGGRRFWCRFWDLIPLTWL